MPTDRATKTQEKEKTGEALLKDLIGNRLNPLQQNVLKTVQKVQKQQVEEAMQAGVPPESILKDLGIDVETPSVKMSTVEKGGVSEMPQITKASGPFASAKQLPGGGVQESGPFTFGTTTEQLLNNLVKLSQVQKSPMEAEEQSTLIAQRKANTALMEKMLSGQEEGNNARTIYRDPITGAEVDPETAQKDMEEGLGIYQMNQVISTRSGIVEKPLNKVPELTQEEKKYVNDARMMESSLGNLESGFENLYSKYGKSNWQSFQIENMPYILAQDPIVQSLKSDLIYLKAAIPFMRGGKQLTKEEGKRIDVMLNPFGKSKETYKKDIDRFENEFGFGTNIMKFGINAGIMKKLVNTNKKKQQSSGLNDRYQSYLNIVGSQ